MVHIRTVLGRMCHWFCLLHHLNVFIYAQKLHENVKLALKLSLQDPRISDITDFGSLFFTNWNITFQAIYYLLAVVQDVMEQFDVHRNLQKKIGKIKGFVFNSLMFPCSIFVTAMFWGVYYIDRELVFPEVLDEFIPSWLNHCLHTNICIFLLIEVIIVKQFVPSVKSALITLTALIVIYDILLIATYLNCGRFIYGLFDIFNWPQRITFLTVNYLASILMMMFGIGIESFKLNLEKRMPKVALD